MPIKWQYFLAGLLAGIILTGVVFLLIARSDSQVRFTILTGQDSEKELDSNLASPPTNQGKININSATLEELTSLPGIGPSKAAAIIDFRNKYGLFESVDELLYVPGFGESLFSSIKELITVE
jgi:competence protein ComEA